MLMSIGTVEPIEYGIVYNAITKSVNAESVYPGGWYFIGPVMSFITFPSTLVNIDFTEYPDAQSRPLVVKDNDGQEIRLSFSVQYRLQQDKVGELYNQFQKGYEVTFISYIDSTTRKIVGDFDSTAFWKDRKESGDKIRAAINTKLNDVFADCTNLQIINVQLSDKREQSLIQTQVTKQQGKTKTKEQKAKEIRSNIIVMQSESSKEITQIQGKASAEQKRVIANATSAAQKITIDATTEAYKVLAEQVGIAPETDLDKFIYYSDLQTAENTDIFYHVGKQLVKLR